LRCGPSQFGQSAALNGSTDVNNNAQVKLFIFTVVSLPRIFRIVFVDAKHAMKYHEKVSYRRADEEAFLRRIIH